MVDLLGADITARRGKADLEVGLYVSGRLFLLDGDRRRFHQADGDRRA
jgi:hypothetical protein